MKKLILVLLTAAIMFSAAAVVPSSSAAINAKKGMDVSYWNGKINWTTAKNNGIDFAILRVFSWGKDSTFEYNYAEATKRNITVGAYIYMYAESEEEARWEASEVVAALGGKRLDYPIYLDVEDDLLTKYGKKTITDWMILEMEIFRKAGYTPAYYTFTSFMNSYIDTSRLKNYELWQAEWPYVDKTYVDFSDIDPSRAPANATLWQFCDNGSGAKYGCSSDLLDLNYSYKSISPQPVVEPSGKVLKVTYDSTGGSPGYKYLDKAAAMMYTGYKLCYDVYLDNDKPGIGGIELDDKYANYARDDSAFKDQNGLSGSPKTDISDYAYKRWYHREISLPDSWNGVGYANFYSMIAFDGSFQGKATAYFDNIRIVNSKNLDVEYFFKDNQGEFSYVNDATVNRGFDYTTTNYNGVNAQVVDISEVGKVNLCNATVNLNIDNAPWNGSGQHISLKGGGQIFEVTEVSGNVFKFEVPAGTYNVYYYEENTGITLETEQSSDVKTDLNFYTVKTELTQSPYADIKAYCNGVELYNGNPVLMGKTVEFSVQSTFNKGETFIEWSDGSVRENIEWIAGEEMPKLSFECVLWGDINRDGLILASDALTILQHSVSIVSIDPKYLAVGDVDGDGSVDANDALLTLQFSIGLITEFKRVK